MFCQLCIIPSFTSHLSEHSSRTPPYEVALSPTDPLRQSWGSSVNNHVLSISFSQDKLLIDYIDQRMDNSFVLSFANSLFFNFEAPVGALRWPWDRSQNADSSSSVMLYDKDIADSSFRHLLYVLVSVTVLSLNIIFRKDVLYSWSIQVPVRSAQFTYGTRSQQKSFRIIKAKKNPTKNSLYNKNHNPNMQDPS